MGPSVPATYRYPVYSPYAGTFSACARISDILPKPRDAEQCISLSLGRVSISDDDSQVRQAAFSAVRQLSEVRGDTSHADLKVGFEFQGDRIPLVNPQRGIFKPQRLLIQKDGPMIELLKTMHGEKLHLPAREKDRPDRDRLITCTSIRRCAR